MHKTLKNSILYFRQLKCIRGISYRHRGNPQPTIRSQPLLKQRTPADINNIMLIERKSTKKTSDVAQDLLHNKVIN